MEKTRTIVVWGSEDILSAFVELFLANSDRLQVFSVTTLAELEAVILHLETKNLDIVIVNQEQSMERGKLPLQCLHRYPSSRVIAINLENNALEVYSKQQIMLGQAADLLAVIENEI